VVALDKVYSSLMAFPIFGGLLEKFGCCGKAHPAKSSHVQLSITSFLHGLKAAQTYVDHMFGQFWDRNPSWLLKFAFSLHPGCSHFFAIFFAPVSKAINKRTKTLLGIYTLSGWLQRKSQQDSFSSVCKTPTPNLAYNGYRGPKVGHEPL